MPLATLTNIIQEVVDLALTHFASSRLIADELAISLELLDANERADYRGNETIYPASIVKLFYLAAAHQWLEDKRIVETNELKRALKNMIVDSSNEATHYVVDLLTGTTGGPELPPEAMQEWVKKRNVINEYFKLQGYQNINVNQKTWEDGPYGREREFVGQDYENRNLLTANAAAKLLSDIVTGRAVNSKHSQQMLALLARDYTKPSNNLDDQATCFSGRNLLAGCKLWSKAGWTSQTRHDVAYIELPSGKRCVLAIFTVNHAYEYDIIPFIASEIIKRIS